MIFQDVKGEPVIVALPAHCLQPPLNRYALLVAETIKEPQEIWYEWISTPIPGVATVFTLDAATIVRRYLACYLINDERIALTVITTTGCDGWEVRDVVMCEDAMVAARSGIFAYREGAK